MKTYISDIFSKLQQFSQKLDDLTLLTNQHWVVIDDTRSIKTIYIFRSNNELLVSTNGRVEKAKWEYLGNKSLLIDKADGSYLFKHGFFDANVLALKVDSSDEHVVFVNENRYDGEINSIEKVGDFLRQQYLDVNERSTIEMTTGQSLSQSNSLKLKTYEELRSEELDKEKTHKEELTFAAIVFLVVLFFALFVSWVVTSGNHN